MKKYLCGVSFQHELGETNEIGIFDSLEELKSNIKCWEQCGVVEIEIEDENTPENWTTFVWVQPQNMDWGK